MSEKNLEWSNQRNEKNNWLKFIWVEIEVFSTPILSSHQQYPLPSPADRVHIWSNCNTNLPKSYVSRVELTFFEGKLGGYFVVKV